MSSHFLFHSNVSETVPFNAKFAFPTQASRIIQSTVKIPPRTGVTMGGPSTPLSSSAKGRVIQITLPSQGYLNPLESYLRFDLGFTSTNTGANPVVIAPRVLNSVHTMFRRMRVLYGSMVLEDIQFYGALVRTLTNVAVESEYQSGVGAVLEGMGSDAARGQLFNPTVRGPATGGVGTGGVLSVDPLAASVVLPATAGITANFNIPQPGRSTVVTNTTITQDGLIKHTFTIQIASGVLTQQKLIPLKWLANQLTIELEIEEPSMFIVQGLTAYNTGASDSGVSAVIPALSEDAVPAEYVAATNIGTAATMAFDTDAEANPGNIGYYLDNIYYVAEILEFDSTYDAAFFQGMASGGVPIKFSSWNTHQHTLAGTSTILTIQERARSVKSAFAIIRKRDDQDPTYFRSDPYWCYPGTATAYSGGSVATLWHEAGAGIDEFQWRIGGRYFPSQPVKCTNGGAEPLMELQKALNLLGDYSLAPPIHQKNWMAPRGTFVIACEFESTNGFEMSGINAEELADLALVIKLQGGGAARANATSTAVSYDAASFGNATDNGKMYCTTFVNYDALLIIRPNNVMELVK